VTALAPLGRFFWSLFKADRKISHNLKCLQASLKKRLVDRLWGSSLCSIFMRRCRIFPNVAARLSLSLSKRLYDRSERPVDWRHREHSSLSRNEVRAYGLFLGQKASLLRWQSKMGPTSAAGIQFFERSVVHHWHAKLSVNVTRSTQTDRLINNLCSVVEVEVGGPASSVRQGRGICPARNVWFCE
jgi:hypothetical protein